MLLVLPLPPLLLAGLSVWLAAELAPAPPVEVG